MQASAKKMEFQSQTYVSFWPAVMLSERAKEKARDLEILHAGFPSAFQSTLLGLLNESRRARLTDKIQVVEMMPDDQLPQGIRISYRLESERLLVCDIWTPLQPALF